MTIEQANIEKQEIYKFKKTSELKEAFKNNEFKKVEIFLEYVKNNRHEYPQYNDRWVDLVELDLFRAYRANNDFNNANLVIENMDKENEHSKKHDSRQGRINVLSEEIDKFNNNN